MRVSEIINLVLFLAAIGTAAPSQDLSSGRPSGGKGDRMTVKDLPLLAQYEVSRAIGEDRPAYHVQAMKNGKFRAEIEQQGLVSEFGADGVMVQAGKARLGLTLEGFGFGETVRPVPEGKPEAQGNRVEIRRGTLTEWYVNGPLGLQQGFTVEKGPERGEPEVVTLVISLRCDLTAVLEEGAQGAELVDGAGKPVLRYTGLTAYDARGKEFDTRLEVEGRSLRIRVQAANAMYPLVVDPWLHRFCFCQFGYGNTPAEGARAGSSVAMVDDTVVIGAPLEMAGSQRVGAAYVFTRNKYGAWYRDAKLTGYALGAWDYFGSSVAIAKVGEKYLIVIGAPNNEISYHYPNRGSAFVYEGSKSNWSIVTRLLAGDGQAQDYFGTSVAVAGLTVVVGASGADSGVVPNKIDSAGAVYIFKKNFSWNQVAKLTASDPEPYYNLGISVAIDKVNGSILVGSSSASSNPPAYVFEKPPAGWSNMTETAKLFPKTPENSFG